MLWCRQQLHERDIEDDYFTDSEMRLRWVQGSSCE